MLAKGEKTGNTSNADLLLSTYRVLQPDLCAAVDTWLRNDVAHGMTVAPEELDIAAIFLEMVLIKLKELDGSGKRYTIIAGNAITMSKLAATYWLAHVNINPPDISKPFTFVIDLMVEP